MVMLIDGIEEQCTSVGFNNSSNTTEMSVMRKIEGSMRPVSTHSIPYVKQGDKFKTCGHNYEVISL